MTKTWRSRDLQQALLTSRLILTFPELDVLENTGMAPVEQPLASQHHPGAGVGQGPGDVGSWRGVGTMGIRAPITG